MQSRIVPAVLAACLVSSLCAADLAQRDQVRAYYQIKALKDLAEWEGAQVASDDDDRRKAETYLATRHAYIALAAQYETTVEKLKGIEAYGDASAWPKPGKPAPTTFRLTEKPKAALRPWQKTLYPRRAFRGNMKLVKHPDVRGRKVAESRRSSGHTLNHFKPVRLPREGAYDFIFYCRLVERVPTPGKPNTVKFLVRDNGPQAGLRRIGVRTVGAAAMSEDAYETHAVRVNADAATQAEPFVIYHGAVIRMDKIVVRFVN